MDIASSQIKHYIDLSAVGFSVRCSDGGPYRSVSLFELECLAEAEQIRATVKGKRVKTLYLTVHPDAAGRTLGETQNHARGCLHTDANTTTLRDGPLYRRRHKNSVCLGRNAAGLGWNGPVLTESEAKQQRYPW